MPGDRPLCKAFPVPSLCDHSCLCFCDFSFEFVRCGKEKEKSGVFDIASRWDSGALIRVPPGALKGWNEHLAAFSGLEQGCNPGFREIGPLLGNQGRNIW